MRKLSSIIINCLLIIFLIQTAEAQSSRSISFFELDQSGNDAFMKGDFEIALNKALSDSIVEDTAFRLFKLGVINAELKNESKALLYFRLTAQKSTLLAPFAYEYIGDIESRSKDWQNALNAYRLTISTVLPQKYKDNVFSKISNIYKNNSASLPSGAWLEEYSQWYLPQVKPTNLTLKGAIDSVISFKKWNILDSLLTIALRNDPKINLIISAIVNASYPDSVLSVNTLFSLAQSAYNSKDYSFAGIFFKKAKSNRDFSKIIPEKTANYFEIKLAYSSKDFLKVITLVKKYDGKYGLDSEILMLIARAYRKVGNEDEALKWYNKHVKLYPRHPKTQEILWLIAWRMELLGKYKEAASSYLQLTKLFKEGSHAEESFVRRALCFFKINNYDSSITILNKLVKKCPSSTFASSAKFWKAKAFLAIDHLDSAKGLLREVAQIDPYDYYANRSRQLMQLFGDTTENLIDTTADTIATLGWLDSISPADSKKPLSSNDSISLYRGIVLLMLGRAKESDVFLEQLELSFPGNLELQFKLALVYQNYNASMQAFRVARRLTWRIPQEKRSNLPFLIYKLFYPSFYAETIKREAALKNVDPFLVSSVIRQESIFNPTVVSPAGAVGLMQIMPSTGKEVARRIGEAFTVDSLYFPLSNIRYGTNYLRQLMDEFNDNIVLVLAAYNGGPINAQQWFNRNKEEDFDLFVEDIEFTETRNYVKKVLSNYWTYRLLSKYPQYVYGNETSDNILNKKNR